MDEKRLRMLAGVDAEPTELEKIEEGMFGRPGYGGDKSPEQNTMSVLTQVLRDAKVFLRDGNMKDAAMMIDRAYEMAAKSNRGE